MADGTRTHDNWNHNPGLYRLSYSHHRVQHAQTAHDTETRLSFCCRASAKSRKLACPEGLEPPTLGLEGRCSIQLSYGQSDHNREHDNHQILHQASHLPC